MIPPSFDYYAPATAEEAIGLLQQLGPEAKILSGGMSLIPLMRLRLAAPRHVIDINRIAGLAEIKEDDGFLRIGALTRESELESSDLVRAKYPILAATAGVIGDPLVRNRATVGGNLAHADPANDHPATMLALGAEVVATGPTGERRIPITSFFTGFFATALAPYEILDRHSRADPTPTQRRRLCETRTQGWRLCHGGGRGAVDARRRRRLRTGKDRSHQCRPDTDRATSGRRGATWQKAGAGSHPASGATGRRGVGSERRFARFGGV